MRAEEAVFEPVIVPPAGAMVVAPAAGAIVVAEPPVVAAGAAAALADLLIPPCPLHAPRPPCGEVVPSLHVTGPLPPEDDELDEALPAAGAAAAAGAAEPASAEADLFTPPWPLQAPRPLCEEVVPSLHVTAPLPLLADAEPDDDEPAAGAAVDSALLPEVAPAEADLLMPPCPLQAPRPPCGEVVPSLHTTGLEVLCANEGAGAANSTTANATLPARPMSFVRFICSSPSRVPLIIRIVRILQSLRPGHAASRRGDAAQARVRSTLAALKLAEDYL